MYLRCICTRVANVPNVFKVNQRLLKVGQKTPPQLACAVVEFIRNKNELCDVLGIKFSFAFLSVGKALYFAFHLVLLRVYSILFRAGILFHPCFSMFLSNISISFHVLGYIFFISLYLPQLAHQCFLIIVMLFEAEWSKRFSITRLRFICSSSFVSCLKQQRSNRLDCQS